MGGCCWISSKRKYLQPPIYHSLDQTEDNLFPKGTRAPHTMCFSRQRTSKKVSALSRRSYFSAPPPVRFSRTFYWIVLGLNRLIAHLSKANPHFGWLKLIWTTIFFKMATWFCPIKFILADWIISYLSKGYMNDYFF